MKKIGAYLNAGVIEYVLYVEQGHKGTSVYKRADLVKKDAIDYDSMKNMNDVISSYIFSGGEEFVYGDRNLYEAVLKRAIDYIQLETISQDFDDQGRFIRKKKLANGQVIQYYDFSNLSEEELIFDDGVVVRFSKIYNDIDSFYFPPNFNLYSRLRSEALLKALDILSKGGSIKDMSLGEKIVDGVRPLSYLRANYNIEHFFSNEYDFRIVKSEEEADEYIKMLVTHPGNLRCIDIETTGEDVTVAGKDVITLITIGYDENTSYQFPFRQINFDYNLPIEYIGKIYEAIRDMPKDIHMLCFNGVMEISGFMKEGYERLRVDKDVMVLCRLVDPIRKRGYHTLKHQGEMHLGIQAVPLKAVFTGKIDYSIVPEDVSMIYGCPDCTTPIRLYQKLIPTLDGKGIYKLENELLQVKAQNSYYGLPVDTRIAETSREAIVKNINILDKFIKKTYMIVGKLSSPTVKKTLLYEKLNMEVIAYTPSGKQPATDKKTIEELASIHVHTDEADYNKIEDVDILGFDIEDGTPDVSIFSKKEKKKLIKSKYPILQYMLKLSALQKEQSNMDRILKRSKAGRTSIYIDSTGTVSGRQTSDSQQSSARMKACHKVPEDFYLVDADYSQVELRVLALLSGCQKLVDACSEKDLDIHRSIASLASGKEFWEITDEVRKYFKAVNFGIVYMISEFGLARNLKGGKPTPEEVKEAAGYISAVFDVLPEIGMFIKSNKEKMMTQKKISTYFGRVRKMIELYNSDLSTREIASIIRSGNNTPTQGTAADIIKIAEVSVDQYIMNKGWNEKVYVKEFGYELPKVIQLVSIHDEILLQVHKSVPIEEVMIMMKESMEVEIEGAPPFFSSMAVVKSWGDTDTIKCELPVTIREDIIANYLNKTGKYPALTLDNWVEVINNQRAQLVKDWANGLIAEYKEEAYLHAKDPVLLFMFMDSMLTDKDFGELDTQIDRIKRAFENYIIKGLKEVSNRNFELDKEDKDKLFEEYFTEYQLVSGLKEEITDIDEVEEVVEEKGVFYDDILEVNTSNSNTFISSSKVVRFLDGINIDVSETNDDNIRKIYDLSKKCISDSKYRQLFISFVRGNNVHVMKEKIDASLAQKFMKEVVKYA